MAKAALFLASNGSLHTIGKALNVSVFQSSLAHECAHGPTRAERWDRGTGMKNTTGFSLVVIVALLSLSSRARLQEQQTNMTLFVTSIGPGNGADRAGLDGADRQCQS